MLPQITRMWTAVAVVAALSLALGAWAITSSWPSPPGPAVAINEPEPPDPATRESVAGPTETTKLFHDSLNHLTTSGDSQPMRQLSDLDRCGRCRDIVAMFETLYQQGNATGGEYTVTDVVISDFIPSRQFTGVVHYQRSPLNLHHPPADLPYVDDERDSREIQLTYIDGQWRIVEWR